MNTFDPRTNDEWERNERAAMQLLGEQLGFTQAEMNELKNQARDEIERYERSRGDSAALLRGDG